jgi:hypothetical protein
MHRPFEALAATLCLHPAASACCRIKIVIGTAPSNPNATIMAIIAIEFIVVLFCEWVILIINKNPFLLRISWT